MAQLMSVRLNRGDAPNWGFRLQGGKDFGTPLVVQKVLLIFSVFFCSFYFGKTPKIFSITSFFFLSLYNRKI